MKDQKEITEESFKVPTDMMMDVLFIIVKENLKHEIIEVLPNRNLIVIAVSYDKKSSRHLNVVSNIQSHIADYNQYRSWESEEFNWRGN